MPHPPPTLLWLRADLRLDDNPALAAASETRAPLVVLYVLERDEALRPLGAAARWWLHHSLAALSASLDARGQRLILRSGRARDIVPEVARQARVSRAVWNRRYGPAAAVDADIEAALRRHGVAVSTFKANLLHEPGEIRGPGGPMKVYSAFWRKALSAPPPPAPIPAPKRLPAPANGIEGDALESLRLLPTAPDWAGGLRETWTPGGDGARNRLAAFVEDGIAGYAAGRDRPAEPATSRLSPHLRFGELSPNRILAALGDATGRDAAKFVSELGWREFAWHALGNFPAMATKNLCPEFDAFPWADPSPTDLHAWRHGRTGYPIVDAGMRQLWRTGWMHNRVRMIVASFLTKHLLIDWRIGEAWFWDTLVDADPANNPFGWQWVAGSGFDAQPFFRIFNPVLQGEKFDPDGAYVRAFIPELAALPARFIHRPWEASPLELQAAGVRLGRDYPEPIVDHAFARARALAAYETMRKRRGG
jgi:deoxyribodipyrimidine photo-lyase